MTDSCSPEIQITYDVKLELKDTINNKTFFRSIDKLNAYTDGPACWVLPKDINEQRRNLESWITERGNEQHETILELISWEFI